MDKTAALLEFLPKDWQAATVIILIVYWYSFRLLDKDIKNINTNLTNHVTDTNKKIDKLEAGQAKLEGKIEDKAKEQKEDVKELKAELKGGQDKLEAKLDKLLEKGG